MTSSGPRVAGCWQKILGNLYFGLAGSPELRGVCPVGQGVQPALRLCGGSPADASAAFVGEKVGRSEAGLRRATPHSSKGLILRYFCPSSRPAMRNSAGEPEYGATAQV